MIQNFLDEVLTDSPKYTLRDKDGNIINDDVDISLKTPIQQEGTPLNRELFRNLQGDLYTIDRSVSPNYTVSENVPTFSIDVPLSSYETGKMIKMRCPSVQSVYTGDINLHEMGLTEITASSNPGIAMSVIDNDANSYWSSDTDVEYQNVWVKMSFETAIKIKKMKIKITSSGSSTYWGGASIQGSNNDSSWTNIYNLSYTSALTEITLDNNTAYKYYRVKGSLTSSTRALYIYELQVTECEGYRYVFPSSKININNLGTKNINGTLLSSKDYTLRYNGASWDVVTGNFVSGSFAVIDNGWATISVNFDPDLVILYSPGNNDGLNISYTSDAKANEVPIILTKAFAADTTSTKASKGILTTSGFKYYCSNVSHRQLYYIAIKF